MLKPGMPVPGAKPNGSRGATVWDWQYQPQANSLSSRLNRARPTEICFKLESSALKTLVEPVEPVAHTVPSADGWLQAERLYPFHRLAIWRSGDLARATVDYDTVWSSVDGLPKQKSSLFLWKNEKKAASAVILILNQHSCPLA